MQTVNQIWRAKMMKIVKKSIHRRSHANSQLNLTRKNDEICEKFNSSIITCRQSIKFDAKKWWNLWRIQFIDDHIHKINQIWRAKINDEIDEKFSLSTITCTKSIKFDAQWWILWKIQFIDDHMQTINQIWRAKMMNSVKNSVHRRSHADSQSNLTRSDEFFKKFNSSTITCRQSIKSNAQK